MTGRCMAICRDSRRCTRGARWSLPITFAWDPVAGVGVGGPDLRLCGQHGVVGMQVRGPKRLRVTGGWYGAAWNQDAKVWTVLGTVYSTQDGLTASPAWWEQRHASHFGECRQPQSYDEARAVR